MHAYYMKRALGAELICQSECDRLTADLVTASADRYDTNENCVYLDSVNKDRVAFAAGPTAPTAVIPLARLSPGTQVGAGGISEK